MGTYTGQDKRLKYLFENGGGGGGASALSQLTDVELTNLADGQIIKYDISLQKWVNAEESGGSGGGGSVIDWNNEIFSDAYTVTTNPFVYSYTATQNCFVVFDVINNLNAVSDVTIDTEIVSQTYSNALIQDRKILFLAKGETVEVKSTYINAQLGFKAFGIRTVGVQYVDIADIYSTDEKVVGVYVDGKPLYKKSFVFNSAVTVDSNTWYDTGFSMPEACKPIRFEAQSYNEYANEGNSYPIGGNVATTGGVIYLIQFRSRSITIDSFTMYYTKVNDTAGSGIYVPSGSYATHYTTDEQIIGTWTNGKPLYRKTFSASINTNQLLTTNIYHGGLDISSYIPNTAILLPRVDKSYLDLGNSIRGFLSILPEDDHTIDVYTAYSRQGTGIFTIEYTKTTD